MEHNDPVITALLVDGEDIGKVVKVGRSIPARLEAALIERDRCCVVPGCGETLDLQIDHLVEVARGGPTTLYNLDRMCGWHHYLKTHHNHVLRRHLGHRLFEDPGGVPPDLDDLQQELSEVGFVGELRRRADRDDGARASQQVRRREPGLQRRTAAKPLRRHRSN
jgi:hypothetical protein